LIVAFVALFSFCVNVFSQIRAFVFSENKILKVDLKSNSNPETLQQSLDYIFKEMGKL